MPVVTVSGDKALRRLYGTMRRSVANKIARPALRKAGSAAAKIVKRHVPSQYKGVRKAIGWRGITFRQTSGQVGVKIGAAVGKSAQRASSKQREGRKGVGFDGRNIHWWFMGTAERETGTKRARVGGRRGRGGFRGVDTRKDTGGTKKKTGRMPPQSDPIAVVLAPYHAALGQLIRTWVAVGIKKEFVK